MNNRVLLINAPYLDIYGPIKLAAGRYFPLGLGYIAAVLKAGGFDVRLIDPEAENISFKDMEGIVREWKPGLLGISSATPNFFNAIKIAGLTKRINSNITVVIGGIHVSALPEYVLKKSKDIDIVVIGEGDYTMLEICQAVRDGADPGSYQRINGIAYRDGDTIKRTGTRQFIQDIDTLPYPARDLINLDLFFPNLFNIRRRRSAGMITSRGCPFKCYFCASHVTMGARYRPHSAGRVIDEILMLKKDYDVEQVLFLDDTFTLDRERLFNICESILKKDIKIDWHCFARVSDVDIEALRLMEKAGCSSVGYGVESGDDEVLKGIKKGITIDQARRTFSATNKTGMRIQAFFVFGNKNETGESIDKSIALAKELSPHLSFFNILTPYPGTKAFEDMGIRDLDEIKNWEDFVAIGPKASLKIGELSKEELLKAMNKAYRVFYLRPGQLFKILFSFKTFYEFKQYVKGGVALLMQMFRWSKG